MKINYLFIFLITVVLLTFNTNISLVRKKPIVLAQQFANKLFNPVIKLISVPFHINTVWGIGPNNGFRNEFYFQPEIPEAISKGLIVISRFVLSIISQFIVTGFCESQNS